jgi:hypothetical protein
MMSTDIAIHAETPWLGGSVKYCKSHNKGYSSTLHYRGWTLVDCGDGWRWAVKDGTTIRVRVCRQREMQHHDVMKRYHEVVDERDDV